MKGQIDKERCGPWALVTGASLAEVDWKTVYASGPRGYTDYPTFHSEAAE